MYCNTYYSGVLSLPVQIPTEAIILWCFVDGYPIEISVACHSVSIFHLKEKIKKKNSFQ